jgi:chemotaxis protein MotA
MLQNLDDPSSIGPAMAVALLTTFYGAIMANCLFLPMAKKLEERSNEEALNMELIMEGVLAILNGEHPSIVKEKLDSFLPPGQRQSR